MNAPSYPHAHSLQTVYEHQLVGPQYRAARHSQHGETMAENAEETHPEQNTVEVLVRWSGFAKRPHNPEEFEASVHSYTIKAAPLVPLELGMTVRLLALSPTRYHLPHTSDNHFDVYDPHVEGRLSKVMGWRGEWIALELTNECRVNLAKRVRLEVPYIPGVTVKVPADPRPGKGPRIAEEHAVFDPRLEIGRTQKEWRCAKSGCALRAESFFGMDGGSDPHEKADNLGGQRKPTAPRKKPGVLEAVGWSNRRDV